MTQINNSLLNAYLDGELSVEQASSIDSHLKICNDCFHELSRLRQLKSSLADVISPNPGDEYFRQLQNRIMARTVEQNNTYTKNSNRRESLVSSGQNFLRTLIRLAAVVTLLFASFYAAQIVQQVQNSRWAESASENGLVQEDLIQQEVESPVIDQADSSSLNEELPPPDGEK
jgi:anti-sigma factor RsiW